MERERRNAMERVVAEYQELEDEYGTLSKRYDGARARNKVLEADGRKSKAQVQVLLSKTGTDDALVDALRAEVGPSAPLLLHSNGQIAMHHSHTSYNTNMLHSSK